MECASCGGEAAFLCAHGGQGSGARPYCSEACSRAQCEQALAATALEVLQGGTTARLAELVARDPEATRRRVLQMVPSLMLAQPKRFPLRGTVKRSGGSSYWYLEIAGGAAYVEDGARLLDAVERAAGMDKLVARGGYRGDPARYRVRPPPSPVGAHVTLRKDTPPGMAGRQFSFRLDSARGVVTYADHRRGASASGFDPSFRMAAWYVVYVTGLPPEIVDPHDPPHVSIGTLGWS